MSGQVIHPIPIHQPSGLGGVAVTFKATIPLNEVVTVAFGAGGGVNACSAALSGVGGTGVAVLYWDRV